MIILMITMIALRDKRQEIMQTLMAMIEIMSNENGCRNFQVSQNIKNKNSFSSVGEWDTREAFYQYVRSDNFSVLLGTKSFLTSSLQIQILTVSNSEGIELINAIRSNSLPFVSSKAQEIVERG